MFIREGSGGQVSTYPSRKRKRPISRARGCRMAPKRVTRANATGGTKQPNAKRQNIFTDNNSHDSIIVEKGLEEGLKRRSDNRLCRDEERKKRSSRTSGKRGVRDVGEGKCGGSERWVFIFVWVAPGYDALLSLHFAAFDSLFFAAFTLLSSLHCLH